MRAEEHALEVLRTAVQIEREGYTFYAAAAAQTKDPNAVKMFLSLARDEMEHLGRLEMVYCALTKGRQWPEWSRNGERGRIIFPAPQEAVPEATPDAHELEALQYGMQAERESIAFYQQALKDATAVEAQIMYEYLITEEEGHLSILQAEYDHLTQTGFWFDFQELSLEVRD
jgi:rubrerythrin